MFLLRPFTVQNVFPCFWTNKVIIIAITDYGIFCQLCNNFERRASLAPCSFGKISTYKFKRAFFRHERRTAPKFGTHVRIDTLTLKKLTNPTPWGLFDFVRSYTCAFVISWHGSDGRTGRPDADGSTAGRRRPDLRTGVRLDVGLPGQTLSIVKNLSRRTTPKFGRHVRIDTLTLKKIDPPHPRGV